METNYLRSLAQKYVTFQTQSEIETFPGINFQTVMLFVGVSELADYFEDAYVAGDTVTLHYYDYASLTKGLLKTWLAPFFSIALSTRVICVFYTDIVELAWDATNLGVQYEVYKDLAYFKFAIYSTVDADTALGVLCDADPLLSTHWVGVYDASSLATFSDMYGNARVIYHYDATINPALVQLALTLSFINSTGTPVGNSMDFIATNLITASGVGKTNVDTSEAALLKAANVGFFTYVGDGTENVACEGSLTLSGDTCGAEWVKHYIDFVTSIQVATYITQMNKFRNNDTYQGILTKLKTHLVAFATLGRLSGAKITAPVFSKLPASADSIIVPNAWEATYVDNTRSVLVQGTLYIPQAA